MNINSEQIKDDLDYQRDQVESLKAQVEELGKRLDTIEENYRKQCKIIEKRQKKSLKFLSRINRRQKNLIERAETAITKDELKQEIERLTISIKNIERTAENIISRGATKSDITTAIGNLQVTQQITQQATTPQIGSTWYYF